MALLLSATSSAPGEFYFALDQNSSTTSIEAPSFTATGIGEPNLDGRFIARGDASGSDLSGAALPFQMRTQGVSALQLWNIGMTDAPAGGNSGNNFAIVAYDDASLPLSVPLSIVRATGAVELGSQVMVGYGTELSGATLNVNGDDGASRVFDGVYNRPVPGAEVLLATFNSTGANTGSFPYTAAKSGLYNIVLSTSVDANGLAWTNGTTMLVGYGVFSGGGGAVGESYLAVDAIAVPSITLTYVGQPNYYIKDLSVLVDLNAGEEITYTIQTQGGMNLGVQGGVTVYIQPLIA